MRLLSTGVASVPLVCGGEATMIRWEIAPTTHYARIQIGERLVKKGEFSSSEAATATFYAAIKAHCNY